MARPSEWPLIKRLPSFEELSNDLILDRFLDYVQSKNLTLYEAQEEAILSLIEGQNVILNTPTGSGKSMVAMALHFASLAQGKKSVYTCPIKALVNEKFLSLCREFGPEQVGMITGDGSVNPEAPIICCTAEILSNWALRFGEDTPVDDVIMDEFHYYSDRERGVAWQIPLLTMKRARFLLMSATLGEMDKFQERLTELTERETAIVSRAERPVPLKFEFKTETPLHETIKELIDSNRAPIYLVNFTQNAAADEAQNLMSVDFASKETKKAIADRLQSVKFSSPYGKDIQRFLKHGVGVHHAGLLPKYRVLVEKLAQEGLLKVICGTDTLGVGVNIPIRTVLFTKLCKYDGEKTAILSVRDFHQIAGRAGRKGFDDVGYVVAEAPEHVIENAKLERKAAADPKKAKKIVKAKPPERGFVHWDEKTFNKLIESKPETLESRFQVDHGTVLSVLSREKEDGCRSLRDLIRDSHDNDAQKKKHRKRAFQLFKSLVERGIVEILPRAERKATKVRVNISLQEDFSIHHAHALWLIDTLETLDKASPTYAFDVLTLVESILENPEIVLRKQLDRLKGEKVRELKEAGMEYEERMEELEKLEHPKPLRDFIYGTFNEFTEKHPWVSHENIRPKSVAREMVETYQTFQEYIREYELHRAEGVLLRYLSEAYRALVHTVPAAARTDEVEDIIEYLGAIVRNVDSSLLNEWERLLAGGDLDGVAESAIDTSIEQNARAVEQARKKALRRKVSSEIFGFMRRLAIGDFEEAVILLKDWGSGLDENDREWTASRLEAVGKEYAEAGHTGLLTDATARHAVHSKVVEEKNGWIIRQRLVDPDGHNDWEAVFFLDQSGVEALEVRSMILSSIGPVQ